MFRRIQLLVFDTGTWSFDIVVLSARQYEKCIIDGGIPHGIIDKGNGRVTFLAKSYEPGKHGTLLRRKGAVPPSIDFGYIHSAKFSPLLLLCFQQNWDDWSELFGRVVCENMELRTMPWIEGRKMGMTALRKVFDTLVPGYDTPDISIENKEKEDADDVTQAD